MNELIDYVVAKTMAYIENMPKKERKKYGQFFTSKETAMFMADLFCVSKGKDELSVLDAGAGSGILSIALIEHLQAFSSIHRVRLVCYETDTKVAALLRENLEWVSSMTTLSLDYNIRTDNYITSQSLEYNHMLGAEPEPQKFDLIICNPPYMKLSKYAPEAVAMPTVCYGAPNLYFLFTAMGLFNLKKHGEMVYIIPRSWTSGAYFRRFREQLLHDGALMHMHLFESRDRVFEQENVLQETMIIKVEKTANKPLNVRVTTSQSNHDFSSKTAFDVPYEMVIFGKEKYVRLVTNERDVEVLRKLNTLHDTLPSLGLKMKTGLTVDFRNYNALRNDAEEDAVPLFYAQHIKDGRVTFPVGREHEYIVTAQQGLLQNNVNYLFVKRFTAKEEHRRLQCGVYLARKHPQYLKISTQNKINFIDGLRGLSECVVYGLYVVFNSTLYDCYYRILNGSTQVNSTEVNSMPIPPLSTIEAMGKELIQTRNMSEITCDSILRSYL